MLENIDITIKEQSIAQFETMIIRQLALMPKPSQEKPLLPPLDKKRFQYTLVLDLDETLVHFEATERKFRLRPGCLAFLRALAHPHFEIVVFTAAS